MYIRDKQKKHSNIIIEIFNNEHNVYSLDIEEIFELSQKYNGWMTKADLESYYKGIFITKKRTGVRIKFKKTLILNIKKTLF